MSPLRPFSQFWQQVYAQLTSPLASAQFSGLAIAAVALWGFYEIVESILVQQSQWLDLRVLLALRQSPLTSADPLLLRIAEAGEPLALGLACALGVTSLVWQRQWIPASMVAIGSLGGLALNPLVLSLFPRPISPLWRQLAIPEGPEMLLHGATALLVYGMLGYLLARRYAAWRWAIALGTVILIGSIGGSRLALGLQGMTNLLTGYTVELFWLLACLVVLNIWREPIDLQPPLSRSSGARSQSEPSDSLKF